jgi:hypothetical protein
MWGNGNNGTPRVERRPTARSMQWVDEEDDTDIRLGKRSADQYESQKKGRTTIEVKRKEIEEVNTRTRDALIKIRAKKGEKEGKDGKHGTLEKSKTKCKGIKKETGGKRCNMNPGRMRPKKDGDKNGKGKTYRKGNTTATRGSRRP